LWAAQFAALLCTTLTFLVVCVLNPLTSNAQNMSHEEEVVRNTYAKLSLMCGLTPRVHAGMAQLGGGKIDLQALDQKVTDATPVFDLSDFRVGSISDIASDHWGGFVTDPHIKGDPHLSGSLDGVSYTDNGNQTDWRAAKVSWEPTQVASNQEAYRVLGGLPVSEMIKLGSPQWGRDNVTYTRYAAFTVNLTLQGKSSGPYKAIFFFGTDAEGNEYVALNDLVSEGPLGYMVNRRIDQSGLLLGKIREAPAIADWIRSNVMDSSSCTRTGPPDLCCAHGRCGISPTDFNRDLSVPLPPPNIGMQAQP
jgi:hypothetical protein